MELRARIAAWDVALAAVRAYFRAQGLAEVSTPVRLPAVAIEPYIEPLRVTGGVLATSPELPMKRLLAHGAGPIFQIAHVARASERGKLHAEEFHLVEWYRPNQHDWRRLAADTQSVVAAVFDAVGRRSGPRDWQTHGFLDLVARTTGVSLTGEEDAAMLTAALAPTQPALVPTPIPRAGLPEVAAPPEAVTTLAAWSSFFSSWCDRDLDPWLQAQTDGIHVVEFPQALAALSRCDAPTVTTVPCSRVALRLESHVGGVELSNGYSELTCVTTQRQRFAAVQGLRAAHGEPPLPEPQRFLAALASPGLPPTVGCALGLDRLIALACGCAAIDGVALPLEWSL